MSFDRYHAPKQELTCAAPEKTDSKRATSSLKKLVYLQSVIALALSLLAGFGLVVQIGFGLRKFGGLEYIPRILALSAVRTIGGGVVAAASLYALLAWTHHASPADIRRNLRRAVPPTLGFSVLALPLTVALTLIAGLATGTLVYGVDAEPRTLVSTIRLEDLAAAYLTLFESVLAAAFFCWWAIPLMGRKYWSLPQKFLATFATFLLLRFVAELFRS